MKKHAGDSYISGIPESQLQKKNPKVAYYLAIAGIILTILMAIAVVYYWEFVRGLEGYGYLGAFLISILGGATILVPVPMLAVVFALGGVMKFTWLVGLVAGLGETVGAVTIYFTGYESGVALYNGKPSRFHRIYARIMRLMKKRGALTLFLLSVVLNPFFYPVSLAAGAVRFGLRRFILISLVGKTIKGLMVAYAGYWGLHGLLRMLGMPI